LNRRRVCNPYAAELSPDGADVRTHRYVITISGGLDEMGREAFGDFRIRPEATTTVLTGDLDQAALYGALNRIQSLGFELVDLNRLADAGSKGINPVLSA
jgi:hypothetical protein